MGVAFVKNQSATTEKGAVTGNNLLADSQFNYKDDEHFKYVNTYF